MGNHAQRAHARYSASSAHRWFACPGSVRLTEGMPDVPSVSAIEGTRAHELLEALLVNAHREPRARAAGDAYERRAADLWSAAPQEMRDAVHACVDHVKEIVEDHPDAVVLVEHRFEIPVAAAPGEVFGTCDVVVFVPSMRALHVVDFKYGDGIWVDVKGNKQLRFYGLGAIASMPGSDLEYADLMGGNYTAVDSVCLTIVQPRHWRYDGPAEEWLPVEELLEFGPQIGAAVEACRAPDAPLVPGDAQCQFCPARGGGCSAREALAASAFDGVADVAAVEPGALQAPAGVTGDRLGQILRVAPTIRAWLKDLEEEAQRRLEAGEAVAGMKLVEAQARRQWNSEDVDAVATQLSTIAMGGSATTAPGPHEFKVEKLRTLTEVEAVLKQGCDRKEARRRLDAMAYLTTKKSSGALKVVGDDDPRPAVNRALAFGDVKLAESGAK